MPLLIAALIFIGFLYWLGYRTLMKHNPLAYVSCIVISIVAFAWSFYYADQIGCPGTHDEEWHALYMTVIKIAMPVFWLVLGYAGFRRRSKDYMARYGELNDRK